MSNAATVVRKPSRQFKGTASASGFSPNASTPEWSFIRLNGVKVIRPAWDKNSQYPLVFQPIPSLDQETGKPRPAMEDDRLTDWLIPVEIASYFGAHKATTILADPSDTGYDYRNNPYCLLRNTLWSALKHYKAPSQAIGEIWNGWVNSAKAIIPRYKTVYLCQGLVAQHPDNKVGVERSYVRRDAAGRPCYLFGLLPEDKSYVTVLADKAAKSLIEYYSENPDHLFTGAFAHVCRNNGGLHAYRRDASGQSFTPESGTPYQAVPETNDHYNLEMLPEFFPTADSQPVPPLEREWVDYVCATKFKFWEDLLILPEDDFAIADWVIRGLASLSKPGEPEAAAAAIALSWQDRPELLQRGSARAFLSPRTYSAPQQLAYTPPTDNGHVAAGHEYRAPAMAQAQPTPEAQPSISTPLSRPGLPPTPGKATFAPAAAPRGPLPLPPARPQAATQMDPTVAAALPPTSPSSGPPNGAIHSAIPPRAVGPMPPPKTREEADALFRGATALGRPAQEQAPSQDEDIPF